MAIPSILSSIGFNAAPQNDPGMVGPNAPAQPSENAPSSMLSTSLAPQTAQAPDDQSRHDGLLTDLFAPPQADDVFDALADKPHLADLFEVVGGKVSQNARIEKIGDGALQGFSLDNQNARAKEEALRQRAADFIQKTAHLDESQYRAAIDRLHGAQANAPTLEQPGLKGPGWQALVLSALGAAIDPRHGPQALAAPWLAAQGVHQQDLELARQRYQAQSQALGQALDAAQGDVRFADHDLDTQRRDLLAQSNLASSQADDVARSRQNDAVLEDRKQARTDKAEETRLREVAQSADKAQQRYAKATGREEMQNAADVFNATVAKDHPGLQITTEEVESDYRQRQTHNRLLATDVWSKQLARYLNSQGEVSDVDRPQIEKERQSFAQEFGVDPDALGVIPTGKTLRAQALVQKDHEFEQGLNLKVSQFKEKLGAQLAGQAQNFRYKLAQLSLAERRLQQMAANQGAQIQIAQGNLDVRQQMASLAKDRANAVKDARGEGAKAIKTLDEKIAGTNQKEAQARANKDQKGERSAQEARAALQGQRSFLVSQLPDEAQAQDMMANLPIGGGAVPQVYQKALVPDYQPPASGPGGIAINTGNIQLSGAIGKGGSGQTKSGVKFRVLK